MVVGVAVELELKSKILYRIFNCKIIWFNPKPRILYRSLIRSSMADDAPWGSSPLIPLPLINDANKIDLEAGPEDQIQCRIYLKTDGDFSLLQFHFFFAN